MAQSQYEIPAFGTAADRLLGWCLEAEQEGTAWLNAQRPTTEWAGAMSILSSPESGEVLAGLSNTGYNKTKRIARELVASLAQFKHEGEYKVTWNETLYDQAHTLTNLDRNLYRVTDINQRYREGIQYAVATGTAYFLQTWDKHFHSPFRGDIRLSAISPDCVSFVQLPKDHNIQRSYAVIIREELPINLAKAIYGETNRAFAEGLTPDRQSPGWLAKGLQKVQQFLSPALRVAGRTQQNQQGSFPTVDIFHMYTLDRATNDGPLPVQMGTIGTNWSYTVPALGDPIPSGVINPATGQPFTTPATEEHCRMFPLRRYTIFSRTGICYDGSSPWWHGDVPLARLRFGDWAWEALGSSLVAELRTMQQGIEAIMRGIEDSIAARLDPPYLYDDTLVADSWAKAFNPRMAGSRAKAPLMQGEPIKFPIPPEYYNVPAHIFQWVREQEERMDYVSGVRDLVAIAKAKQIPGADTLEKLLEMAGPIVQDMVQSVATPLQQLGEWRKAYYFQFYTRSRMITVTGPEGVDVDVQYRPEHLVPYLQGESADQTRDRAYRSLEEFHYTVTESGINEINRMTTKLLYIQLAKIGFPISWWTMARVNQIPNFGPPPQGTNTEMERWVAQKMMEADMAVELQQRMQGAEGGGAPGGAAPAGGGGSPTGQEGAGRPSSFSAPPKLVSKDGGTRSTITTS